MTRPPAAQLQVPFGARQHRLDAIRGIAVVMVLAYHSAGVQVTGFWTSAWEAVFGSMWSGVDLFFVLSGYLITGILLDSREHPRYFLNFYARRALRIFPLYYGVLACVLLVLPVLFPAIHKNGYWQSLNANQLWLWVYLHNFLQARGAHLLPGFGHFWSLAIEEQFYWIWPMVVYRAGRRRLLWITILLCAFAPALRLLLYFKDVSPWAIRQITFTRIDSLAWGGMVAVVLRDPALRETMRRYVRWIAVSAFLGLLLLFTAEGGLRYEAPAIVTIGYSTVAIFFAALLLAVADGKEVLGVRPWYLRVFSWLGTISYGIYLFHWPIWQLLVLARSKWLPEIWPVRQGIAQAIVSLIITFLLSTTAAYLSWRIWESPILRFKRYFSYQTAAGSVGEVRLLKSPSPQNSARTPIVRDSTENLVKG